MKTGYADVNGLRMYYEIHGEGRPIVLLHGAMSAIGTSFGKLIPDLAKGRQVIAFELQAHGRTVDIDRPLQMDTLADDTVAALRRLGVTEADFFGYSLGAGVALNIAIRHAQVVRKLALASVTYSLAGFHPGLLEGISNLKPELVVGSRWQQEYVQIAPQPEAFANLIEKIKELQVSIADWPPEAIGAIASPTLLVVGDADIIRLEHAVEFFGLLGGGVNGETPAGMPRSRLAVLPGTSHTMVVDRPELLLPILDSFLD
jgi:pimeloyl-ACP methyl ester carboxylesterase